MAMRGDAEYEGLKKKEKLILFIRQSGFLTHAHSCWRAGQLLQGGCCFDTNQESGMLRLGTSQRCQELEGHAPMSSKPLSKNRAHLSP